MPKNPDWSAAFAALNARRSALDDVLAELPASDERADALWAQMDEVLGEIAAVMEQAAASPARHASELRAKAHMLATILAVETFIAGHADMCRVAVSLCADIGNLL